jgi:hypothetical protein
LIVDIGTRVDLEHDATWRATEESGSARIVEDLGFHRDTFALEFVVKLVHFVDCFNL